LEAISYPQVTVRSTKPKNLVLIFAVGINRSLNYFTQELNQIWLKNETGGKT
jgi:hypothetical protein